MRSWPLVVLLVAGCGKPSAPELAFPKTVAPPPGLAAGTNLHHVHLDRCGTVEDRLRRAWGKPEEAGGTLIWQSHQTHWTASLVEAKGACDLEFIHDAYFGKPTTAFDVAGMTGAKASVLPDERVLEMPIVAARALVQAWGAGATLDGADGKRTFWFDRDAGTRAILHEAGAVARLELDTYLPFDRWLAKLSDPLVGARTAPVMPPTEFDPHPAPPIQIQTGADGTITRATITFAFDRPATRDAMMIVLAHKWGAPRQMGATTELEGSARMRVTLTEAKSQLTVELSRK